MAALPFTWPETPARTRLAGALRDVASCLDARPPRPSALASRRRRGVDPIRLERLERLSDQQRDMLLNVAGGATRAELALDYGVTPHTIDYHLARIRQHLRLEGASAVQFRMEVLRYVRFIPPLCDR